MIRNQSFLSNVSCWIRSRIVLRSSLRARKGNRCDTIAPRFMRRLTFLLSSFFFFFSRNNRFPYFGARFLSPLAVSRYRGGFFFFLSFFFPSPRHADFADTWYIRSELILIERNNAHAHGDRGTHTEGRGRTQKASAREHEHSRGVEIESQGLATPELHAALWLVEGRKFAYYK